MTTLQHVPSRLVLGCLGAAAAAFSLGCQGKISASTRLGVTREGASFGTSAVGHQRVWAVNNQGVLAVYTSNGTDGRWLPVPGPPGPPRTFSQAGVASVPVLVGSTGAEEVLVVSTDGTFFGLYVANAAFTWNQRQEPDGVFTGPVGIAADDHIARGAALFRYTTGALAGHWQLLGANGQNYAYVSDFVPGGTTIVGGVMAIDGCFFIRNSDGRIAEFSPSGTAYTSPREHLTTGPIAAASWRGGGYPAVSVFALADDNQVWEGILPAAGGQGPINCGEPVSWVPRGGPPGVTLSNGESALAATSWGLNLSNMEIAAADTTGKLWSRSFDTSNGWAAQWTAKASGVDDVTPTLGAVALAPPTPGEDGTTTARAFFVGNNTCLEDTSPNRRTPRASLKITRASALGRRRSTNARPRDLAKPG